MTIPKNLEEKRDELAKEWIRGWNPSADGENSVIALNYKKGFSDCANLLLPEIEKLEEALKKITKTKYGLQGYIEENDVQGERDYLANLAFGYEQIARYTLQSLREFLGEMSEGE